MATAPTRTAPDEERTDEFGIERTQEDNPGFVQKMRDKYQWFDHIMLMQDRYSSMGGNQYSAGITYFSVLSLFPILMLVFAVAGFFLASRPESVADIQAQIVDSVGGDIGEQINRIIDTAIDQRGAVAGIGGLTALWSGLSWMNHLRYGVSKMWKMDPNQGNFISKKLMDLVGLLGLLVAMIIAFGITAVGNSGLTMHVLEMLNLEDVPGIEWITRLVSIVVGLIANYIVFFWLIVYLPRGNAHKKSAAKAAIIGAVAFEAFKQLGSLFFSNALDNPAGATFGPIIGVMVLMYFIWRILLYCSAWAATTEESLKLVKLPAPEPAVIRVRQEINPETPATDKARFAGIGAALGASVAILSTTLFRRK